MNNNFPNSYETMVHLEDLTGEKLDWQLDGQYPKSVIIPVETLERIALHLEDLREIEKQVANQQKV
jgi:hypothetical protein